MHSPIHDCFTQFSHPYCTRGGVKSGYTSHTKPALFVSRITPVPEYSHYIAQQPAHETLGPGQRFAIAAMEVWDRVLARDNEVTIRWVPAHSRVAGSEQADTYAKAAARRSAPHNNGDDDDVPDGLLTEASLSHMSRSATEARSRASTEWCAPSGYRPPSGRGLRRQHLRNIKKELAGRYYQFPSGHGSFGSYLKRRNKVDSDRCWFCSTGERQSRFHLVARWGHGPARHGSCGKR